MPPPIPTLNNYVQTENVDKHCARVENAFVHLLRGLADLLIFSLFQVHIEFKRYLRPYF